MVVLKQPVRGAHGGRVGVAQLEKESQIKKVIDTHWMPAILVVFVLV